MPIRRIPEFAGKVSTKSTNTSNLYIAMLSGLDMGYLQRIYKIYKPVQWATVTA
jgi:hypothetical protein